ncbi:hypothetical protein HMPREF9622_01586 [Cutibacterium modestum HL037PA3]|uniref:Uncharacterized protein n=1 Tax=Cutibacterium modestum HL044PA1 TaxID=765109 RepID=A0ABN0C5X2_9ACTN|nr:hypothetical protein HMPREF9607_01203 [Cutibacterium modestum HL044PA1]EFT15380.1 hypothetical protein HMPREF9622_01586 [Cutibacterium modestum HL037PA3]
MYSRPLDARVRAHLVRHSEPTLSDHKNAGRQIRPAVHIYTSVKVRDEQV